MVRLATTVLRGVPDLATRRGIQRRDVFVCGRARRLMKDLPGTTSDTLFAYDGWQVILEYSRETGLPLRQYVYGAFINEPITLDMADVSGEFADGSGEPVTRYLYHQTPIYNVVALTDYWTGALVERYDYDPYGKYTLVVGDTRTESGPSLVGNSMTFTGHWFDQETGMYWMRFRYFTINGFFIGRDFVQSGNLYNYCTDSPINRIDVLGLFSYEFMNDYPDNPQWGTFIFFGQPLTGDWRIKEATGNTNPAFAQDVSNTQYEQDYQKARKVIENMCSQSCGCGTGDCVKEAVQIAVSYKEAVIELRKEFIDKYGWVGSGRSGNGANWNAKSAGQPLPDETRLRRKYNYYVREHAPGPLCYEWADRIMDKIEKLRNHCLRVHPESTGVGHKWEHNFVVVEHIIRSNNHPQKLKKIKLDPWKTARIMAYEE